MHPFIEDARNLMLDTLFPIHCLGCNKEGLFLCLDCQASLGRLQHQECIACRMPNFSGTTHAQCQETNTPTALVSAFDYHDPLLGQAIIWGKYKLLPDVYKILGALLAQYLEQNCYHSLITDAIICPIPLAKPRLRWRGFNQAEIIAWELALYFSRPMDRILQRIKNTKTQKDLTKAERLANVAQSFIVMEEAALKNKNIVLVDDVITTGATLLEAVRLLKSAGADNVYCLTVARD